MFSFHAIKSQLAWALGGVVPHVASFEQHLVLINVQSLTAAPGLRRQVRTDTLPSGRSAARRNRIV